MAHRKISRKYFSTNKMSKVCFDSDNMNIVIYSYKQKDGKIRHAYKLYLKS